MREWKGEKPGGGLEREGRATASSRWACFVLDAYVYKSFIKFDNPCAGTETGRWIMFVQHRLQLAVLWWNVWSAKAAAVKGCFCLKRFYYFPGAESCWTALYYSISESTPHIRLITKIQWAAAELNWSTKTLHPQNTCKIKYTRAECLSNFVCPKSCHAAGRFKV